MDSLPSDVQELVDHALNANRREARVKRWLTAAAAVVAALLLGSNLYVAWQNHTQGDQTNYIAREVRCYLVPGQPCYQRDQQGTAKTLSTLTTIIAAAEVCSHDPRIVADVPAVLDCVQESLSHEQQPSH